MGQDDITPVPAFVPGDFTVVLGDIMPAYVMEELEEEFAKFGGAEEDARSSRVSRRQSRASCRRSTGSNTRCRGWMTCWRGWPG
jgi:hypothetical protein